MGIPITKITTWDQAVAVYQKLRGFLSVEWEDSTFKKERGTLPAKAKGGVGFYYEGIYRLRWAHKPKTHDTDIPPEELRRPTFEEFIQAYQIELPTDVVI